MFTLLSNVQRPLTAHSEKSNDLRETGKALEQAIHKENHYK